jgi:CheY-like chemotaxis protein
LPTPLRVLILEDQPADAEMMVYALRETGFAPTWTRVDTEVDYGAALDDTLDLILADYSLPQFNALRALKHLKARGLDIPFIVVTGSIEEAAVECMQQGAADYLLKDRLARLGPAVARALEEKRLRETKYSGSQLR